MRDPRQTFCRLCEKIEDEQLELDATGENKLVIRYLDSDVSIKGFDADDYPVFKEVAKERSFIILKKNLKELINKIIFNVATDEARPSLRGCCLNIKKTKSKALRPTDTVLLFPECLSKTTESKRA